MENDTLPGSGKHVRIAVLDSGIEQDHPKLTNCKWIESIAYTTAANKAISVQSEAGDLFGHGTAVAGIIHRIAPEAEIGSFQVLGPHLTSRTQLIALAAQEAIGKGYHIINCSFGCGIEHLILSYKHWIDAAYLSKVNIVAAANNQDYRRVEWPAHFNSVIAVKAAPAENPELLSSNQDHLVSFTAPASFENVPWLNGTHKHVCGSSFSTAYMTGLVAKLISEQPDLEPWEVKTSLQKYLHTAPSETSA